MSPKNKIKNNPAYIREQGKRQAVGKKKRNISFSLSKHIPLQGQSCDEWEKLGLLSTLFTRIKFLGQFSVQEALQKQYIKQYTKVGFPPNSGFKEPKHLTAVTWTVMHITSSSKEVVVGH